MRDPIEISLDKSEPFEVVDPVAVLTGLPGRDGSVVVGAPFEVMSVAAAPVPGPAVGEVALAQPEGPVPAPPVASRSTVNVVMALALMALVWRLVGRRGRFV